MSRAHSFFLFLTLPALVIVYINSQELTILFFILAVSIAAVGITMLYAKSPILKTKAMYGIALAFGIFLGHVLNLQMNYEKDKTFIGISQEKITGFKGFLIEESKATEHNTSVCKLELISVGSDILNVKSQAQARVLVFIKGDAQYYAGQVLEIKARLSHYENIMQENYVSNAKQADVSQQGFINPLLKYRYDLLKAVCLKIDYMGYPASGFFKALVLGNKQELTEKLEQAFKNTGTYHLLALSGLHVGIIFALISLLIYPLPNKSVRTLVSVFFVLCYLFLVGARPSLLRASLMLVVGAISIQLHREFNPINILAISLFIILIIDPFSVHTLSFKLSYCALLGILTVGQRLNSWLIPYIPKFLRIPLCYSIGAQIFTAPLVLSTFVTMYPIGIIVTIILLPLITVFILAGIIFLFISFLLFPPLNKLIALLFDTLYNIIFSISNLFSQIPGISLEWSDWYWIPFVMLTGLFVFRIPRKQNSELRFTKTNKSCSCPK